MKVLSLLQPWASLVVLGYKQIETRGWNTEHRGDLLIHASSGRKGKLVTSAPPFTRYIPDFEKLPFGAIIGKVQLTDVFRFTTEDLFDPQLAKLSMEEKAFGDYAPGRYGWVLEDPEIFADPIPAKGSLRLWDFDTPDGL
ncbi:MAG: ASCH domain-containing protein [Sphingobacteriales bacterium]|nr:MAG: ASCH domain-containing protein [Sphingobacteriales bacterium]